MTTPRYTAGTTPLKAGDFHLVFDNGEVCAWCPSAERAEEIASALNTVQGIRGALDIIKNGPDGAASNVMPFRARR